MNFSSKSKNICNYNYLRTIGIGAHGRVKLAYHSKNKHYYAIKIMKKSKIIRSHHESHTINQKTILSKIKHPFIIKFIESAQDHQNLYLVMEYISGGDLWSHLKLNYKLSSNHAALYAAQVLLMLNYLHEQKIIYRDLKPQNLAIDDAGYLKLIDFGLAKIVSNRTYTICGTPQYLAPEVILNKGYGKGVDWWALGVLIYQMLSGETPFQGEQPMEIYYNIVQCKFSIPKWFSREATHLIKNLVIQDLSRRFGCINNSFQDLKNHSWFKSINFRQLYDKKIKMPYIPSIKEIDQNFAQYPESNQENRIYFQTNVNAFGCW